ncbi:MAG TPA: MBOAT family O-acyltransferase, partial [Leptospiraceae bacterium]|nr:MBOAT family O-acyltransferase [Leptospiraceae bacterium]
EWRKNANNLFTYFLSGLWHGASWTFAIWGLVNGICSVLYKLTLPLWPKSRGDHYKIISISKKIIKALFTLVLISAPTIYFRSQSFDLALLHSKSLFTNFGLLDAKLFEKVFRNIALLLLIEIYQNSTEDEYAVFRLPVAVRSVLYVVMFYAVTVLGNFNKNAFIYFVF